MSTLTLPVPLTPEDVERASKLDAKRYELIDGELKEKIVGFRELFIATRIAERLNQRFYPNEGAAAVEAMTYCFQRSNHGRKPDVVYVARSRWPNDEMPEGDLHLVPDLVIEVLSPGNGGIEIDEKLNEYLAAGIPLVWIVNPEGRTIRVYREDGTTKVFHANDVIENEPVIQGFRLVAGEVFPVEAK